SPRSIRRRSATTAAGSTSILPRPSGPDRVCGSEPLTASGGPAAAWLQRVNHFVALSHKGFERRRYFTSVGMFLILPLMISARIFCTLVTSDWGTFGLILPSATPLSFRP